MTISRRREAVAAAAIAATMAVAAFTGGQLDGEGVAMVGGFLGWVLAGLAIGTSVASYYARDAVGSAGAVTAAAVAIAALVLVRLGQGVTFDDGLIAPALLASVTVVTGLGLVRLGGGHGWKYGLVIPIIFALLVLFLWQAIVVGYGVSSFLLPAPSAIAAAAVTHSDVIARDFTQTVLREALPGFVIGSGAAIACAVAVDRSPFLQAGLLPISSWLGVMPIVGIAPIMVMWFGFDWQSKVAVVVLMTFFPTFVTTLGGLRAPVPLERDLLLSYSASYSQSLWKLRLPNALPFILSALKVSASLALIGSIIAEFFGSPIYGLGFRIALEAGRLGLDRVWAAIAVAAVTGAAAYGAIVLFERTFTFWHPSQRNRESI